MSFNCVDARSLNRQARLRDGVWKRQEWALTLPSSVRHTLLPLSSLGLSLMCILMQLDEKTLRSHLVQK